jgi:hypothetical protein
MDAVRDAGENVIKTNGESLNHGTLNKLKTPNPSK